MKLNKLFYANDVEFSEVITEGMYQVIFTRNLRTSTVASSGNFPDIALHDDLFKEFLTLSRMFSKCGTINSYKVETYLDFEL